MRCESGEGGGIFRTTAELYVKRVVLFAEIVVAAVTPPARARLVEDLVNPFVDLLEPTLE